MEPTMTTEIPRRPPPEGVPTCRVCGCWEYDACWEEEDGACWWVEIEPPLCSSCAPIDPETGLPEGTEELLAMPDEPTSDIDEFLAFLSRQGVTLLEWDRMRIADSGRADELLAIYDEGEDGPDGFRP